MDSELLEATGAACTCRDCEAVVSPAAYLADLLDYVVRHVRKVENGTEEHVSLDYLYETFHQPFDAMPATTCEATEDVERQVRLCIEVLRRELDRPLPDEDAERRLEAAEADYRQDAYEAFLEQIGTSVDELRTARSNADERESLADRLGIAEAHLFGEYPDPYDDEPRLYLDRDEVTEDRLEDLFGLANTNPPPEATPEGVDTPQFEAWRLDYLRDVWTAKDFSTDAYSADVEREKRLPVIDPDVIGPDDFRNPDTDTNPAFELWETRREWVDDQLTQSRGLLREGEDSPVSNLEATYTLMREGEIEHDGTTVAIRYADDIHRPWADGPAPAEFQSTYDTLTEADDAERIEDARQDISSLHLTVEEFTRFVQIQRKATRHDRDPRNDAVSDDEWRDVHAILVQAQKRALYPAWINEESSADVTLGPKTFWVSLREPAAGQWPPERPDDRPLVDPERVDRGDLPESTAGSAAVELWNDRQSTLDDKHSDIAEARESGGFDAMLAEAYGAPPGPSEWDGVDAWEDPEEWDEYLDARREQVDSDDPHVVEQALEDVERTLELTREDDLEQTRAEFTHLLEMRVRADPESETQPPTGAEWAALYATLATNWKRKEKYAEWRDHERENYPYWRLLKAHLPPWRASHGRRNEWQQALEDRSRPPVVDPDIIHSREFVNPVPGDDAYELRTERMTWLGDELDRIESLGSGEDDRDRLNEKLSAVIGVSSQELEEGDRLRERSEEFTRWLDQRGLTNRAYSYVRHVLDLVDSGAAISKDQWRNVDSILLEVSKGRQFGEWRREERARGPTLLRPAVFELVPDVSVLPEAEGDPGRWRVDRDRRREWENALGIRAEQRNDVEDTIDETISTVEEETLPQLRDALVMATTPPEHVSLPEGEPLDARAEWVTDRFLVDAKAGGCQETTRIAQAIETLQTFVFAIQMGQEELRPVDGVSFVLRDDQFDERWEWLGSYSSWKAAVATFLYPENVLLPSLRGNQTPVFEELVERAQTNRDLTSDEACEFAKEYSEYYRIVSSLTIQATCWAETRLTREDACAEEEIGRHDRFYMFARRGDISPDEKSEIYWSAYDPVDDHQTFWKQVPSPGLTDVVEIIGAAPYREHIYLFCDRTKAGGRQLSYTRYSLEDHTWSGIVHLDVPDSLFSVDEERREFEADLEGGREGATLPESAIRTNISNLGSVTPEDRSRVVTLVQRSTYDRPPDLAININRATWLREAELSADVDWRWRIYNYRKVYRVTIDPESGGWAHDEWPAAINRLDEEEFLQACVGTDDGICLFTAGTQAHAPKVKFISDKSLNEIGGLPGHDWKHVEGDATEILRLPVDHHARGVRLPDDLFGNRWVDKLRGAFVWGDSNTIYHVWQGAQTKRSHYGTVTINGGPGGSSIDTSRVDHELPSSFYAPFYDIEREPGVSQSLLERIPVHTGINRDELDESGTMRIAFQRNHRPDRNIIPVFMWSIGRQNGVRLATETSPVGVTPQVELEPGRFSIPESLPEDNRLQRRELVESAFVENESNSTSSVLTYLKEAYFFVPMFLALGLQRSREYEAALDWFRTIYDYSAEPEARKIYYGLETEEELSTALSRSEDWILDPLDVHAIASTRKEAYTRFTLFSITRCLLEYADEEFTRDTKESLARARTLYKTALDLLEVLEAKQITGPCDDLGIAVATGVIPVFEGLGDRFDEAGGIEPQIDDPLLAIGDRAVTPRDLGIDEDLLEAEDEARAFEQLVGEFGPSFQALGDSIAQIDEFSERRGTVTAVEEILTGDRDTSLSDRLDQAFGVVTSSIGRDREPVTYGEVLADGDDTMPEAYSALLARDSVTRQMVTAGTIAEQRFDRQASAAYDANGSDIPVTDDDGPVADGGEISPVDVIVQEPGVAPSSSDDAGVASSSPNYATSLFWFCIPPNPLLDALGQRAAVNLYKLRNCMNIAGMRRRVEPYAAPIDIESSLPTLQDGRRTFPRSVTHHSTPYRYETLIDRAKELVDFAQQLESRLLGVLEARDREAYRRLQARQDKKRARAGINLQTLRVTEAEERVEHAKLQRERARTRVAHYADLRREGKLEDEKKALLGMNIAASLYASAGVLHGAQAAEAQTKKAVSFGILGGSGMGHMAAAQSSFASAASTRASVLRTKASYERRRQEWELQESLARKDVDVGSQQITIAESHVDVVEQERAIAEMRYRHAEEVAEFLENKFTNTELYDWMSDILEDVYRYFLQQATATARLAESQLAFERHEVPPAFIQADYWEPPTRGQSTDPDDETTDRHGLTGSARLLRDIYKLDQYAFETDERKLQLTKTISLAREYPYEFERFRETGVLIFDTPMEMFDRDFPGHYLRLIKRVRTSVLALVPPTEGINATLSTDGISRVVAGDELFQTRIVRRDPESVALTSPRDATGLFELRPQHEREKLLPFESMGVDTRWEFEMPKAANQFDYDTIADVLLTIEYTALEDLGYRQQVIDDLDAEHDADRAFSFRQEFADQWFDLNNVDPDADSISVRFTTRREDFLPNVEDLLTEHLLLYFVGAEDGDAAADVSRMETELSFTGRDGSGSVSAVAAPVDGVVSTRSGSGVSWLSLTGNTPVGEWELSLPNTPEVRRLFEDEEIEDILFVITYAGRRPEWSE